MGIRRYPQQKQSKPNDCCFIDENLVSYDCGCSWGCNMCSYTSQCSKCRQHYMSKPKKKSMGIADKIAALRAAKPAQPSGSERITLPDGTLSIHDAVFETELVRAGRTDIDFLMSRPVDERDAILQAIEINPAATMKFLDYDN